tara:strand:+ start:1910 stop:2935 length:1026 start_codon:yes stop_codon:yes gene_type:complete
MNKIHIIINKLLAYMLSALLFIFPIHLVFIFLKNLLYDFKIIQPVKINSTVISVGNVALGGTGKTPTTISIANFLQKKGFTVGVVSRGHGRRNGSKSFLVEDQRWRDCGDEVVLLKNNLHPKIHVYVSQNKIFASKQLSDMGCNIILLDDGFQHRKIHRDIDIVLLGPENHIKKRQFIYPYGLLREPISSIKRADITIMTKKNMVDNVFNIVVDHSLSLEVKRKILSTGKNQTVQDLLKPSGNLSVCSVGDPTTFSKTLKTLNISIQKSLVYPDHWPFSMKDVKKINALSLRYGLKNIICTEKDYVKLFEFKNHLNVDINAIALKHVLTKDIEKDILSRIR